MGLEGGISKVSKNFVVRLNCYLGGLVGIPCNPTGFLLFPTGFPVHFVGTLKHFSYSQKYYKLTQSLLTT